MWYLTEALPIEYYSKTRNFVGIYFQTLANVSNNIAYSVILPCCENKPKEIDYITNYIPVGGGQKPNTYDCNSNMIPTVIYCQITRLVKTKTYFRDIATSIEKYATIQMKNVKPTKRLRLIVHLRIEGNQRT